jgi:hypothetical protein
VCHDLRELRYELRLATARLRHKQHVIPGCIRHAGLALEIFIPGSVVHLVPVCWLVLGSTGSLLTLAL